MGAGLRVLQLRDQQPPLEIAHGRKLDILTGHMGTQVVYAGYPSEKIAAFDREAGLIVLDGGQLGSR